jgi:nucleotide-binding universal stress UspA family protein
MNVRPSILCPIDFSEASSGALRYAAALATHFATRLIVLAVEDPLLTEALDLGAGVVWNPDDCKREMQQFAGKTFGEDAAILALLEYEVAVGKPAPEILRVARERSCDLIVISTHGLTGMRKLFFGSTTERVLRETTRPVLVTPPHDPGQTEVARGIADALGVPLIVLHVVEPLKTRLAARLHGSRIESNRRALAEDGLNTLLATSTHRINAEALVAYGDPAEEVAKVARDRQAGLIVMGLHGSPLMGPRMGSVTYRILCLAHTLVLALPPNNHAARDARVSVESAARG